MDFNDNDHKDVLPINNTKGDEKQDLDDDYNPYRDDKDDDKEDKDENEPKQNIFDIDPDKGNISEQLGMEFDYPTQTKIAKNQDDTPFNDYF